MSIGILDVVFFVLIFAFFVPTAQRRGRSGFLWFLIGEASLNVPIFVCTFLALWYRYDYSLSKEAALGLGATAGLGLGIVITVAMAILLHRLPSKNGTNRAKFYLARKRSRKARPVNANNVTKQDATAELSS